MTVHVNRHLAAPTRMAELKGELRRLRRLDGHPRCGALRKTGDLSQGHSFLAPRHHGWNEQIHIDGIWVPKVYRVAVLRMVLHARPCAAPEGAGRRAVQLE